VRRKARRTLQFSSRNLRAAESERLNGRFAIFQLPFAIFHLRHLLYLSLRAENNGLANIDKAFLQTLG
jgi:hypothetical protein